MCVAAVVKMKTELRIRLASRVALELPWCRVRDKIAVKVKVKVQRKYSRTRRTRRYIEGGESCHNELELSRRNMVQCIAI